MQVCDALPLLQRACNIPFKVLLKDAPADLWTNKGNVGQLLLTHLGLPLDSAQCDFADGELKTNKAKADGMPIETMFICQISRQLESLISDPPARFEDSYLHKKIRSLVYLPVVKTSPVAADWYFVRVIHIRSEPGTQLFEIFRREYESICASLRRQIDGPGDGHIHTTSGPANYIQIRTKDSKPYHPIFSTSRNRYISDKNYAWYFMKRFMEDAVRGRLP